MENNIDITVIIPIHEFNESVEKYLISALDTVQKQDGIDHKPEVLIVYATIIEKELKFSIQNILKDLDLKISLIKNNEKTDFQSQINLGVENVKTNWFTILEYDDELSTTYFKQGLIHIDAFNDVDLFLPIIVEVNDDQQALKLTNETVWSKHFVGQNGIIGYLNSNSLNQYTDFKISGGLFKKSEFIAVGKLKTNIKLTFAYEFLLRLINNGGKVYTIPKIGCKHLATRKGSLFHEISQTMNLKERKFWFETAKKEYNFFNDRIIDQSVLTN